MFIQSTSLSLNVFFMFASLFFILLYSACLINVRSWQSSDWKNHNLLIIPLNMAASLYYKAICSKFSTRSCIYRKLLGNSCLI